MSEGRRIEVRGLRVAHGRRQACVLDGIDLDFVQGEVLGVVGPNGAGKSTLLKAVCGLITPREGYVRVGEVDLLRLSMSKRAQFTSYVPQKPSTAGEEMAVFDSLALGLRQTRDISLVTEAVVSVAQQLDLSELLFRKLGELSGGQQQRVLIGRALVRHTPFLLLDEPVNNLDLQYQVGIMESLRDIAQRDRVGVVAVLHDMNLAATFCDRIVVLASDGIVGDGAPTEVITQDLMTSLFGDVCRVFSTESTTSFVVPKKRKTNR